MPAPSPLKPPRGRSLLKLACGAGVIFAPLILAAFLYYSFAGPRQSGKTPPAQAARWNERLDRFDELFAAFREGPPAAAPEALAALLDSLESASIGAQSRLSLLKRRRALSRADGRFSAAYQSAAQKAALDFPHSAPVCALAAEALVRQTPYMAGGQDSVYQERRAKIAALSESLAAGGPLSEPVYAPLAFAFLSLAGFFATVEKALSFPRAGELFAAAARQEGPPRLRELTLLDAALLSLLKNTPEAAAPFITKLETAAAPLPETLAFLSNYYYDFSDLERAAALFSKRARLPQSDKAESLELAADALYLAGWRENAAQFWQLVANDSAARGEERLRALYNLASGGGSAGQRIAYLERLFMAAAGAPDERVEFPAFMLYTRLLPDERARALLEEDARFGKADLLDLELLKRNAAARDAQKTTGDIWLLLNRHPYSEKAYEWAAWFFEYQKQYEQPAFLRHFAGVHGVTLAAFTLNESLEAARSGDIRYAEDLLIQLEGEALPSGGAARTKAAWVIEANLGLLREKRHALAAALEHYEEALRRLNITGASSKADCRNAARLYARVARCQDMQGKTEEVRPALEKALALDEENVAVRLALSRKQQTSATKPLASRSKRVANGGDF